MGREVVRAASPRPLSSLLSPPPSLLRPCVRHRLQLDRRDSDGICAIPPLLLEPPFPSHRQAKCWSLVDTRTRCCRGKSTGFSLRESALPRTRNPTSFDSRESDGTTSFQPLSSSYLALFALPSPFRPASPPVRALIAMRPWGVNERACLRETRSPTSFDSRDSDGSAWIQPSRPHSTSPPCPSLHALNCANSEKLIRESVWLSFWCALQPPADDPRRDAAGGGRARAGQEHDVEERKGLSSAAHEHWEPSQRTKTAGNE